MFKKSKLFNYKQYKCHLHEFSDMELNNMHVREHFPTEDEILAIPITKIIILSVNSFGYSGKAEYLIVN